MAEINFPSNSISAPITAPEVEREKKNTVVSRGGTDRRKPATGQKIKESIFSTDMPTVISYLLQDNIIPHIQDTIYDTVQNGIKMLIYGTKNSPFTKSRGNNRYGKSKVSYNSFYDELDDRYRSRRTRDDERESRSSKSRITHDFDEIKFVDRYDAENVLSHLLDCIADYDMASVADFYELAGENSEYTDQDYGWTNLRDTKPVRVRGGWVLRLPRPKSLK